MSDKEQKKDGVCCQLLRDGPGTAWAGFDVYFCGNSRRYGNDCATLNPFRAVEWPKITESEAYKEKPATQLLLVMSGIHSGFQRTG